MDGMWKILLGIVFFALGMGTVLFRFNKGRNSRVDKESFQRELEKRRKKHEKKYNDMSDDGVIDSHPESGKIRSRIDKAKNKLLGILDKVWLEKSKKRTGKKRNPD